MKKKLNLSVIVITKNEAHNIADCLESVQFADECLVIDSGSTDKTVDIAKRYTPLVEVTDWPGDGPQKLRGLQKVRHDWVLILDADERVSPELAEEIYHTIDHTEYAGFDIPYQSSYCGKIIRHGDWANEKHCRLFNKTKGTITPDVVHCRIQLDGRKGLLKHPIYHHPFHHLSAMLYKMNDYSEGSAKMKHQQGQRGSLAKALSHGIWTFIRGYIIKLGFLDGKEGFMLAMSNAEGTYYRYLKLMYLSGGHRCPQKS